MNDNKIKKFMLLAGHKASPVISGVNEHTRKLGAQLLLSEVLEYVIRGLGVHPVVKGVAVTDPEDIEYVPISESPDTLHMLDGLADVAYTMYWNANAFGLPLEEAFEHVCDNNLEKFVHMNDWLEGERRLLKDEWHCWQHISWPSEVVSVEIIRVGTDFFAVGKDARGKVRKPSSYRPVDLSPLIEREE